jgi:hypothetical protein
MLGLLENDVLLSETEAARLLTVTRRALQSLRLRGEGPRFRKLGAQVRYSMNDIRAFADAKVIDHRAAN